MKRLDDDNLLFEIDLKREKLRSLSSLKKDLYFGKASKKFIKLVVDDYDRLIGKTLLPQEEYGWWSNNLRNPNTLEEYLEELDKYLSRVESGETRWKQ